MKIRCRFEEYSISDVDNIMVHPLHFTGVKLVDVKNNFGIKDATTENIPGSDIRVEPDMDYLSFKEAHWISMTQLFCKCSHSICDIVCPGNAQSLLYDVSNFLLELPMLKQQNNMVHSMVQSTSKIPPSSIKL